MRCIKCGKELRIAAEQVGYDNNGLPIFHRIGYCDECKLKTDIDSSSNNKISNDISKLKTTNIVLIVILCISLLGWCCSCNSSNSQNNDNLETSDSEIKTENSSSEVISTDEVSEEPTEEVSEPEISEEEYKESCQEYDYKDVLRNPSDYVGKKIVIEMEISTVHSEDLLTPVKYYFGYTKDEPDDNYYLGDRYAVFDCRYDMSLKLLEDDVIIVWGEISEPQETSSLILNSEELFCIDMKYAELISE